MEVQGHLGGLGRRQAEASEEGFIQDLRGERHVSISQASSNQLSPKWGLGKYFLLPATSVVIHFLPTCATCARYG